MSTECWLSWGHGIISAFYKQQLQLHFGLKICIDWLKCNSIKWICPYSERVLWFNYPASPPTPLAGDNKSAKLVQLPATNRRQVMIRTIKNPLHFRTYGPQVPNVLNIPLSMLTTQTRDKISVIFPVNLWPLLLKLGHGQVIIYSLM